MFRKKSTSTTKGESPRSPTRPSSVLERLRSVASSSSGDAVAAAAARQPGSDRDSLFENLYYPVSAGAAAGTPSKSDQQILRAARKRAVCHRTPPNKHLDLGKDRNELEMLMEKFQPEFEQIVPCVVDALQAVITKHSLLSRRKSVLQEEARFSTFDTSAVPEISLEDYLWRIVDYTYVSPTSLILACVLVDRLILQHGLLLTELNVYKLFFTAVRVASKVHELRSLSNKNFAVVGGVTTEQMNALEASLVTHFRWNLWVEHEDFAKYCQRMMQPDKVIPLPRIEM